MVRGAVQHVEGSIAAASLFLLRSYTDRHVGKFTDHFRGFVANTFDFMLEFHFELCEFWEASNYTTVQDVDH